MVSSFDVTYSPPSHFLKFRNREKSLGAKFGESDNNSYLNSTIFAVETTQVYTSSLFCWKMIFSFSNGALFPDFVVQSVYLWRVILCTNRFSFLQVIGVDVHSTKRGRHFSGRFHYFRIFGTSLLSETHCFDYDSVPVVWWCVHISSTVMHRPRCWSGLRLKSAKTASKCQQTRDQSCRNFFHLHFFVQNWKHSTFQYVCGHNYFRSLLRRSLKTVLRI